MDDLASPAFGAAEDPVPAPMPRAREATGLRPVINATGILLHGALGRAPLSAAARAALDLAAGTIDLEFDLATGRRDRRGRSALAALATAVPAAAAVHIVNNEVAALVLAVAALAAGREVVVSRGELGETTDGLRLPDLLATTGARLREVGTTNRTTLGDYARAIGPQTGVVLRVHTPGYQLIGFTDRPALGDLAELCVDLGVPLVGDSGSGLLCPEPHLPTEPDVTTWLDQGVAVVLASGDRLLGGPQCGLLFGHAGLIDRMRRHPLSRAGQAGKLTLAALEATLRHEPPVRQALRTRPEHLVARAERLARWLRHAGIAASAVASRACVDESATGPAGGHALRGYDLPSAAVAVDAVIAMPLRDGQPAVLGRVEQGCCLLDLRAVPAELDPVLGAAILAAATAIGATALTDPPTAPQPIVAAATTHRSASDPSPQERPEPGREPPPARMSAIGGDPPPGGTGGGPATARKSASVGGLAPTGVRTETARLDVALPGDTLLGLEPLWIDRPYRTDAAVALAAPVSSPPVSSPPRGRPADDAARALSWSPAEPGWMFETDPLTAGCPPRGLETADMDTIESATIPHGRDSARTAPEQPTPNQPSPPQQPPDRQSP
ncbi:L-seryl-tRNA(Sec) selenium transferase [Frankia sp. Ag45/Mut15]|uniref:L-seryl-tRNA(Sec) selenium transferase n=1 Tax=Frankia umida TaxID=573489 RepID=A0ABT0JT46_9ACTN|nr:L-seryl-tRNA(Sec) selenium transferase [Frankia umida]MCK9874711.1 L-seryl-tRNA(Sec) selenium transferase [Frankia umida]